MNTIAVVGFSGGVTSAWCAGWAVRTYGQENVVLLYQDTREEHKDTYRFLLEMAKVLDLPITERSDGRNLDELIEDMNMLPNNEAPFCSRILKVEPANKFMAELIAREASTGVSRQIVKVTGFSAMEPDRVQRATSLGWKYGYSTRFPMIEEGVTKQEAADWCSCIMGVKPSDMYEWADHANCLGCVRGGKAYQLAVMVNAPETFAIRVGQEAKMGHTFSSRYSLLQIAEEGLKRKVGRREAITVGPCDCGD